jgi:hypothetical protein
VPAEVTSQLHAQEQLLVRIGTKYSTFANLSWFLFLPLVLAMGLREPVLAALILIPVGLSAACAASATWLMKEIPYWIQLVIIILAMLGILATTRMYGPLMLLPQLVIAITIVLQAHPSRSMRRLTLGFAVVALVVPLLLEVVGVVPASYRFEDGVITVLPQLNEIPRDLSIAVLFGASLLALIVPCVFIAKLRSELTALQVQQIQQAWQFRRVGDELIGARLASSDAGMQRAR